MYKYSLLTNREPSVAQRTHRRILPPFTAAWSKITILAIFSFKSGPTKLRSSKSSNEHFCCFPEFPNKIGQGVHEL